MPRSTVLAGFMAGLGARQLRRRARSPRRIHARSSRSASPKRWSASPPSPRRSLLDALTAIWIAVHPTSAELAGGAHGDPLHRRVPRPDRADVDDGRHAAAGDQVGGRARGARRRHASACSTRSTPPAPSSARWSPASISSPSSASPRSFQIAAATNIAIGVDRDRRPAMRCRRPCRAHRRDDALGRRPVEGPHGDDATAPGAVDVLRVGPDVAGARDHLVPHAGRSSCGPPRTPSRSCSRACWPASRSAARSPRRCSGMRRNWMTDPRRHPGRDRLRRRAVVQRADARAAAIDAATPWFERLGLNTYLAPLVVSSLIAMLPTTILLGLAFPIGLTLWAGDSPSEDTSRRAGTFLFAQRGRRDSRLGARRLRAAAAARHAARA